VAISRRRHYGPSCATSLLVCPRSAQATHSHQYNVFPSVCPIAVKQ
jgi:hypothetical protein